MHTADDYSIDHYWLINNLKLRLFCKRPAGLGTVVVALSIKDSCATNNFMEDPE